MNIFLFQSSYLISLENYKLKMTSGLDGTPSFLLKDFDLGKAIDIYFQNVSVNAVFVPRGWRVKFVQYSKAVRESKQRTTDLSAF